jgi:hypothetical protein
VTSVLRRSTVAVAATAVVLSAGGASLAVASPHAPAATHHIKSGKTTLALNGDSVTALLKHHFALAPTGKAKVDPSTFSLTFPVTGGTFASATKGTIKHTGGIKISHGTTSIVIKNLVLSLHKGTGTAVVSGHGRMSALTIGDAQGGSKNSVSGYTVSLSKPIIKVLDKKFHSKAFKKNPTLGTGSTKLKFKK